jgi:hypothetical protein
MKVYFGQIYIDAGIEFPFSIDFQKYLAEAVTAQVAPSGYWVKKYGRHFDLIFRISAKREITKNEIRGPTVFRKAKDIEYSIFLPFDVVTRRRDIPRSALRFVFKGVYSVLESLEIDTGKLKQREESVIEKICSDPKMFEEDSEVPEIWT